MKGKKIKKKKQKIEHFKWFFSIKTKDIIPHSSSDQIVLTWANVSKTQNHPTSDLIPDWPSSSLDIILILLRRKLKLDEVM